MKKYNIFNLLFIVSVINGDAYSINWDSLSCKGEDSSKEKEFCNKEKTFNSISTAIGCAKSSKEKEFSNTEKAFSSILTAIHCAKSLKYSQVDAIKRALASGAKIDELYYEYGWTILYCLMCPIYHDALEYLLNLEDGKKLINQKNSPNGQVPLHEAAVWGNYKAAKLLVEHGADISIKNNHGETAYDKIFYKYHHNYMDDVELAIWRDLLQGKDSAGESLAYLLTLEDGKLTLEDGKKLINQQDKYGNVPLHEAVLSRNYEAAKLLVEHGADVFIKNNFGKTPYDILLTLNDIKNKELWMDLFFKGNDYLSSSDASVLLSLTF